MTEKRNAPIAEGNAPIPPFVISPVIRKAEHVKAKAGSLADLFKDKKTTEAG